MSTQCPCQCEAIDNLANRISWLIEYFSLTNWIFNYAGVYCNTMCGLNIINLSQVHKSKEQFILKH